MRWQRHIVVFVCALSATAAFAHELDGGIDDDDVEVDGGRPEGDGGIPAVRETVVRSGRLARSASEVVISQDVIQAAPRTGVVDLLRLVPGLVASQHSGEGKAHQLFLRGFDAVHGQDVELNVAGLPVNEVSHLHALGYADLNWLIADAVREVRVTEGSYRAWQGDFAVAGTVRYELGLEEKGLTVAGSYGSFNRQRLFAGFRPFDAPETFAALELVRGDGFGPQRAFGRASMLGQLVVPLDGVKLRAVIGSAVGRFDSPGVVREDTFVAGKAGFFDAFGSAQGGSSSRHQLLLGAELPGDTGRTNVEVFGVLSDLRLRNNFTGFVASPTGDGLEQTQRDGLVGARVEHHRHLDVSGQAISIDLGVGGRRDDIEQSQRSYRDVDTAATGEQIAARIVQSAANAWTEVSIAPGPWRFMLGGRADAIGFEVFDGHPGLRPNTRILDTTLPAVRKASFGVHWGLKAAIERQLGSHVRLYGNYGDGFRSPQARALADGETAPFVSVRGAELGASFDFARVVTKLALFGSQVSNDVFFDHVAGTTVSLGPSLRGGASLIVTAKPLEGWLVSGSFTVATARVTTSGALLPYFAPLVGRLDTSYSHVFTVGEQRITGRVGAGLTFIGARPLPFNDFSRAVFLADTRASVRWRAFELVFDVQNLLDSRWRDGEFAYVSNWDTTQTASLVPARHFTAGSPRSLFVTLEVHL
jgi:iron complex outermembrane recepter protein